MATIASKMSALGNEPDGCTGCKVKFERGETMSAVEYENGDPAGWFCDSCIDKWKTGELSNE